jgi:uncharacterized phage infection (PIP) family protein YhgE
MRFKQFQIDERQKAREMYPHLTEEQLDEILPALVAGVRTAGMTAFKGARAGVNAVKTAGNIARKGVNAVKTGANVVKKGVNVAKQGVNVAKQGVNAVKNTVQMGKDAINQLKGGAQGGIDNGQAVDDVAMQDPKVMQQQKKTLQAQLKAQEKSHKDTTTQLKQQIASIK